MKRPKSSASNSQEKNPWNRRIFTASLGLAIPLGAYMLWDIFGNPDGEEKEQTPNANVPMTRIEQQQAVHAFFDAVPESIPGSAKPPIGIVKHWPETKGQVMHALVHKRDTHGSARLIDSYAESQLQKHPVTIRHSALYVFRGGSLDDFSHSWLNESDRRNVYEILNASLFRKIAKLRKSVDVGTEEENESTALMEKYFREQHGIRGTRIEGVDAANEEKYAKYHGVQQDRKNQVELLQNVLAAAKAQGDQKNAAVLQRQIGSVKAELLIVEQQAKLVLQELYEPFHSRKMPVLASEDTAAFAATHQHAMQTSFTGKPRDDEKFKALNRKRDLQFLDICSQVAFSKTRRGGNHSLWDVILERNAKHPNDQFCLIEATPSMYQIRDEDGKIRYIE